MTIRFKLTTVVILWILFWALTANFSFGGLYRTSIELNILVFIGMTSFWLGSLSFRPFPQYVRYTHVQNNTLNQLKKGFKIAVTLCAIVQIYLLWKFITILIYDPVLLTRQLLFGTANQDSVLFESNKFALIYFVFVQSAMRIATITGFTLSFFTGKFKFLLLGNVLTLVDSLLFLGRGALLEFAFQSIFYFLLLIEFRRKVSITSRMKIGIGIITLVIFGSIVGVARGDTHSVSISEFLKNQIINYHTVGFVILDQELSDQQSRLNTNTSFGRASLGGVERLIVLVIRRFDKSIDSVSGENGEYLAEFRVLGNNNEGLDLEYNAFATIFYTFLLDGGYLFMVIAMAIFGAWISRERALFLSGNASRLTTLYVLVQSGFNSLFFSPVESTTFWIVIISLSLIRKIHPRHAPQPNARPMI